MDAQMHHMGVHAVNTCRLRLLIGAQDPLHVTNLIPDVRSSNVSSVPLALLVFTSIFHLRLPFIQRGRCDMRISGQGA